MFSCPGCGGNLKFDIPSQKLKCEFCSFAYDPYEFESKDKDAEERQDFDVTIFSCPQCGGEILSTDTTAAGFCSFCGASTVLYSRISKQKRPSYIIPFLKTKEECKQSYASLMRKAIFAPKALKDPSVVESFRGIYMPYWTYHVTQKGLVTVRGSRSKRRGDYVYTDHFQLSGDLDATYQGFSHDASEAFDDEISEAIAPYDTKEMKPFTPSFFSGFYADTADVSEKKYRNGAIGLATTESAGKLKKMDPFRSYSLENDLNATRLNTKIEQVDSAMFPVWFMSYRYKDRVAYATVNGQTGKIAADIPIEKGKYYLGTLLFTIPIFLLLTLFVTMTPRFLLGLCGVIALISLIIYISQRSSISDHKEHLSFQPLRFLGWGGTLGGFIFGAAVFYLKPVSDVMYYTPVVIILFCLVIMFTDIITCYNMNCTHKLPQFDRKGGDDRA